MDFDDKTVQQVWEQGRATNDKNANEWRKDACGAWIRRDQYGNQTSEYGWKIQPVEPGKPATLGSLRPFHHANSFDLAIGHPHCQVSADREGVSPTASIGRPRNKASS